MFRISDVLKIGRKKMTQSVSQLLPTNECMNDKAVYRKSAATPDLLMKYQNVCLAIFLIFWHLILVISCPYQILPSQGFFYLLGQCEWININIRKTPVFWSCTAVGSGVALPRIHLHRYYPRVSCLYYYLNLRQQNIGQILLIDRIWLSGKSLYQKRGIFYTSFKTIVVFNPFFFRHKWETFFYVAYLKKRYILDKIIFVFSSSIIWGEISYFFVFLLY